MSRKNIQYELAASKQRRMKEDGKEYIHKNTKNRTQKLGTEWVCDFETLLEGTKAFNELNDTRIVLWVARRRDAIDNNETIEWKEYKIITGGKCKAGTTLRQKEIYEYKGFVCGTDGESFLDFVLNSPKSATFYFHNLKYDGTFIVPLLSKHPQLTQVHYNLLENGDVEIDGYDDKGKLKKNYWDVFRDGRKIYNIKLRKYAEKSFINITFRCTYLMLSSSVKALGNALGEELFDGKTLRKFLDGESGKGEDFYRVEPVQNVADLPKEYFDYCCRDVEIVRRHINHFHNLFNQEIETIKNANKDRAEHNDDLRAKGVKNNNGIYKEDLNIWGMGITIAGTMRKLLHSIYVPEFQYNNPKWNESIKFLHNPEKTYGNMSITTYDTHSFFTVEHNLYEDIGLGVSKFFRGGFTQFNPKYRDIADIEDIGDCGKWDVSSAYPFQMTKQLPFGEIITEEEFKEHYWNLTENEYYEFLIVPVKKSIPKEIAKHCATLPNYTKEKDSKYGRQYRYSAVEQEYYTLAMVKQEWDEIQHWYDFIIDEDIGVQRYYMLSAPFLSGISNELYNEKNRFSREGKSAQKQGVKIAINSVYGSLGIRSEFDSLIYVNNDFVDKFDKSKDTEFSFIKSGKLKNANFRHTCDFVDTNYKAVKIKEEREFGECWNIAAAAVITALERVYLMETIRAVGAEYFAYADTDSIVFANMSKDARERMETIERTAATESGLGNWEVEYRYIKAFTVHKAKEYIQYVYDYNDKLKSFVDKNGNPCDKEHAKIKISIKGAGFKIPDNDLIKELFTMTLPKRQLLSREQISMYYPDREIDDLFIEYIRQGRTLILEGDVITKSLPSGDIIIKKDKWTSYGVV